MNQIHFQILGITVPSGEFRFHDDGYIDSFAKKKNELNLKYNPKYPVLIAENEGGYERYGGMCTQIGSDIHIYYARFSSRAVDILVRAHEETHALEFMGCLEYLEDCLYENQNVKIDLNEVEPKETRISLGALYALHSRGFSPWITWLRFRNKDFLNAMKIYRQSKLPHKNLLF